MWCYFILLMQCLWLFYAFYCIVRRSNVTLPCNEYHFAMKLEYQTSIAGSQQFGLAQFCFRSTFSIKTFNTIPFSTLNHVFNDVIMLRKQLNTFWQVWSIS